MPSKFFTSARNDRARNDRARTDRVVRSRRPLPRASSRSSHHGNGALIGMALASLHQAVTDGFNRLAPEIAAPLRNDVARLESRMLRRFGEVDARFDKLERRVTVLEERTT